MLVLESQYVIPFFANLILKSVGKLLSFSKIVEKGYYSPVNQGWQDVGRVFRDWSFPFAMSTPPPLGFSDHLLTFLEPSQGLAARDTAPHVSGVSQPRVLPSPPSNLRVRSSIRDFLTPLEDLSPGGGGGGNRIF